MKKKMVQEFLNLIQMIHAQIQEAQESPSRINTKKATWKPILKIHEN